MDDNNIVEISDGFDLSQKATTEVLPNDLNETKAGESLFSDENKTQQIESELFLSLKSHIDSQSKLIQLYQSRIRSFERFRKCCHTHFGEPAKFDQLELQTEYKRFEQNYRYWRKRLRKLRKQTKSSLSIQCHNPYDTLYELFVKIESLERTKEILNNTKKSEDRYLSNDQIYPEISLNVIEPPAKTTNGYCNTKTKTSKGRTRGKKNTKTVSRRSKTQRPKKEKIETKTKTTTKPLRSTRPTRAAPKRRPPIIEDTTTDSDSSVPPQKKAKTKTTTTTTAVKKHRSKSGKLMTCEVEGCNYSTTNAWSMKVHTKVKHSTDRPFKCDKCDMTFKVKGVLKTHQNIHEKRRYVCTFEGCTVNYAYRKDIQKHIKIYHTKEAPLFHCDWEGCQYSTYDKESLKIHRNVHTGEKQYKCPECELIFRSSSNLYNHRKLHDNERRFKCHFEGCDYSTYSNEYLKVHQVIHTGERQFKCVWPECGQAFKTSSSLWSHKMMHENQRRYKCTWEGCDYAANLPGSLQGHIEKKHEKKKKPPKQPKNNQNNQNNQNQNQNNLPNSINNLETLKTNSVIETTGVATAEMVPSCILPMVRCVDQVDGQSSPMANKLHIAQSPQTVMKL